MNLQTTSSAKKKASLPPATATSTPKTAASATSTQAIVKQLRAKLAGAVSETELQRIQKACEFSIRAHQGQSRASGEPYVHHPMQVAMLMAELHLDAKTIIAGILHDVIEDTPITRETLEAEFGASVTNIVDGVSKIDFLERHSNREEAQALSLQKMILAMTNDMRVILVKLIDRLHNIRTLGSLPITRQRRIARETLEVYAAIAHRLGMDKFRREFENSCFKCLYPMRYRAIHEKLNRLKAQNRTPLKQMRANIHAALTDAALVYSLENRNKSAYSVYRKMARKHLSLSVVTDIFGFRIVVPTVDDCYRTVGILHNLYKPVPGKFKDYIALPKDNGYQSLHTVLFGPRGIVVEAQIRTRDMDTVAENGIAGHHLYKTGEPVGSAALVKAREWMANLTELHEQTEDSKSFVAGVKLNLFPNEVFVFTPKGRIYELPRGATILDFAFAIHTGVGLACQSARVDNQPRAISERLKSGQTIEIVTSPNIKPKPDWLGFLTTAKARAAVQHHLKKMRKEDAHKLGRRLLSEAAQKRGNQLGDIKPSARRRLLKRYALDTMRDLYCAIGTGEYAAHIVVAQLLEKDVPDHQHRMPITLGDDAGLAISYGHCCYPVPGDAIVGALRSGRGLTIHRRRCANIPQRRNTEILPARWPDEPKKTAEYLVAIRVEARHERGVLATIAGKIAEAESNIEHVHFEGEGGPIARLLFTLNVADRAHLEKVMRRIRRSFKEVKVTRVGLAQDA